ncbi:uncharacterized protein ENSP00000471857 [Tupaia chinensis]|uniref:uncharacterized protein ENSP00000471857 n=1 Tax=Tupaia chinensis TaxID=246437 RepID=UPI0003C8F786|nr:uncharacterized protein ENSP00000471857 [Tupaia chinensis]
MNGMANVSSASRPHCASSIPVPRASSQTRIHTPGASPQLRPRQPGLALSPQRAASPRPSKAAGPSRNTSPKASRGRSSPKTSGAVREPPTGEEGPSSSPWGSPRIAPRAALSSRTGPRRAGETHSTQGKKKEAQEGVLTLQTRGRSPSRTSCHGETQIPGTPEGWKPPSCPGKDSREISYRSSGIPRSLEPEDGAASGASSPICSPAPSKRPSPTPAAISFSSVHQQSQPVTATVAPFRYRVQTDQDPGPLPLDGYSGPPIRTEESISCMALKKHLEAGSAPHQGSCGQHPIGSQPYPLVSQTRAGGQGSPLACKLGPFESSLGPVLSSELEATVTLEQSSSKHCSTVRLVQEG